MILDGLLAAPGDDQDLVAAGSHRLFHPVLDDGLVHQRQHLFGLSFGGGQKAGAQAGGWENGFADFHSHEGGAASYEFMTVFIRVSLVAGLL